MGHTYYFLALVNRKDKAHKKCVEFSNTSEHPVVTTAWILLEVGDALRRGRDREVFVRLLHDLADDPDTTILSADQELLDRVIALFAARPDKEWSLTDCTSFVVMQEQALTDALTADHHFEQAGFAALLAAGS
ncbi:MAG: PIN domain-containing protein [Planctomycetes bacterium]|nr:PIN domain-containing protein [Planctomycetota bacterium]